MGGGLNANVVLQPEQGSIHSRMSLSQRATRPSAHPDDLIGLDCFVAEFWNGYDESDDEKIIQFREWGWADHGGHLVLVLL